MTTTMSDTAAVAAIGAATRELHLPVVRAESARLAELAQRGHHTYLGYLAEVLSAEIDERSERRRQRLIKEARFPRTKRLADFDLAAAPTINPATLATLASGNYLDAGEPIVLLGDSGTGKTHLLLGLGLAAREQGRRVRYAPPPNSSTNSSKQPTNAASHASSPATASWICSASTNLAT